MTSLGAGEEGKKQRLKLQSRMLEYDMMAFKGKIDNKWCRFLDNIQVQSIFKLQYLAYLLKFLCS